ncbi:uncharacterized protein SCHCODRAFT_02700439 [Schizophyllum commune H4-8]|nr:uncharacterized protein SCHCODRAFT_02700439 [Schizophyllum commune H4-8]KAI5893861.1 hypothetical protein SCHCODRAFT_02700439 [Schizophyllum commune H4-8]
MLKTLLRPTTRAPCARALARRRIFSFPPLPEAFSNAPQTVHESKVLPYTQKELYEVVSNVESYPRFIPYCSGSRILERPSHEDGKHFMKAELTVGFKPFNVSYTSHVTCIPHSFVEAVAAPSASKTFKTLSTVWNFKPAQEDPNSTHVTIDLSYAFTNPLHAAAMTAVFSKDPNIMIRAFEKRCAHVFGRR